MCNIKNVIVKYVRLKDRTPVGVVCAIGPEQVGWSKCNFKAGDRFNKKLGKKIAVGRAISGKSHPKHKKVGGVDFSEDIRKIIEKSKKYFKNC